MFPNSPLLALWRFCLFPNKTRKVGRLAHCQFSRFMGLFADQVVLSLSKTGLLGHSTVLPYLA